jgi:hypothetical protein
VTYSSSAAPSVISQSNNITHGGKLLHPRRISDLSENASAPCKPGVVHSGYQKN